MASTETPFAWGNFRKPFIEALAVGRGAEFVSSWERLLAQAIATIWDAEPKPPMDYAHLYTTFRSFVHLRTWWLPPQPDEDDAPAVRLAGAVQAELGLWSDGELADTRDPELSEAERSDALRRSKMLADLASDMQVVARISARLLAYDPRTSEASPHDAVQTAVRAEIEPLLGETVAVPKRTDLGKELRRRLALPRIHAHRRELDVCRKNLTPEEDEFLQVAYTDGYKALRERGWSVQKIKEVGQATRTKLVEGIPALSWLIAPKSSGEKRPSA